MNGTQRNTVREMAVTQIQQLKLLVEAIDAAESLQSLLTNTNTLVSQYAVEIAVAEAQIKEDEATIQIKDSQLKVAESDIESLKLDNITLKHENERMSISVTSHEDTITGLQDQLDLYRNAELLPSDTEVSKNDRILKPNDK
jgi:chromosome segregation ATPase